MSEMIDSLSELVSLIKQLERHEHPIAMTRLGQIGLTPASWEALWAIDREASTSGVASSDEGERAYASGALVDELRTRHWVIGVTGSGGQIRLHITQRGSEALRRGSEIIKEIISDHFADLSDDERARMSKTVEALVPSTAAAGGPST